MKNTKKIIASNTVSKGYRLKPSTHKMIKRVQVLLAMTQDALISKSVRLFRKRLGNNKTNFN